MNRILYLLLLLSLSLAHPAHAEYVAYKGAVWTVPCGGRCYQAWKFISIDSYDKGIIRALIEVVDSYDGVMIVHGASVGKRFWQFAACHRGLIAAGYASDGSDLQWESVLEDNGLRKDGGSSANLFSRWEAICKY